jgi:hypothetical protein
LLEPPHAASSAASATIARQRGRADWRMSILAVRHQARSIAGQGATG